MGKIEKMKTILQRKTKLKNSRYIEINLDEISRELDCSISEVQDLLNELCISKDIKALVHTSMTNDYTLTVLEKSSIWSDWH